MCPICEIMVETLTHALWECPLANDVWGEDGSPSRKWVACTQNFEELWSNINGKQSQKKLRAKCHHTEEPLAQKECDYFYKQIYWP